MRGIENKIVELSSSNLSKRGKIYKKKGVTFKYHLFSYTKNTQNKRNENCSQGNIKERRISTSKSTQPIMGIMVLGCNGVWIVVRHL